MHMPEQWFVTRDTVKKAEQVLIDNGIEEDEAKTVLQAIGYTLLDTELYPRTFRASNIQWDKTDDDGKPIEADLPLEVKATCKDLGLDINAHVSEVEDRLSDWLSDTYGFCHHGFFFEELED